MRIHGIQKLTLLDYPGRVACTLFTAGCDLRCPYCHNAALVLPGRTPPPIPEEEIVSLLSRRRGILEGVCITGGEPTLQPELPEFIAQIKAMGYAVKLDTNGRHPAMVQELVEQGLIDYVAMDIKNCPERYGETVGVPDLDLAPIRETAAFLMAGSLPFEFRTTVVKPFHDNACFRSIGQWLAGPEPYWIQGFEDSGDLIGAGLTPFSEVDLKEFCRILSEKIPNVKLRGE